jgi:hypothetical protein
MSVALFIYFQYNLFLQLRIFTCVSFTQVKPPITATIKHILQLTIYVIDN